MSQRVTPAVPADLKGVVQVSIRCLDLMISTSMCGVVDRNEALPDLCG